MGLSKKTDGCGPRVTPEIHPQIAYLGRSASGFDVIIALADLRNNDRATIGAEQLGFAPQAAGLAHGAIAALRADKLDLWLEGWIRHHLFSKWGVPEPGSGDGQ